MRGEYKTPNTTCVVAEHANLMAGTMNVVVTDTEGNEITDGTGLRGTTQEGSGGLTFSKGRIVLWDDEEE